MSNADYVKKWLNAFAGDVGEDKVKAVGIGSNGGFLWHCFSYRFVACLEGDKAREAYDGADKRGATVAFYELRGGSYGIGEEQSISQEYETARSIDSSEDVEVYILGRDGEWCYIRTHEPDFGPYFCRKPD